LHDEQGALHSARIGEEPDFFVGNISDNRNLLWNFHASPQLLDFFDQVISVVVSAYPSAIDENFYAFAVAN